MKDLLKKFIPDFVLSSYHFILSFFGAAFYLFPSRKLIVIGVTGTNGKSTVVEMISKILEAANYKVASFSSIKFKIIDKEWPNNLRMTMPGRFFLQKLLKKAVRAGCQYAVLEVTSEGIKQHRHRFINFKAAVFTNLSPEHIEAHGGFDNYRKAKMELFKKAEIHVINLDDPSAEHFLRIPAEKTYGYGIDLKLGRREQELISNGDNLKLIKATDIKTSFQGIDFIIGDVPFYLNLLGGFNVYNALAAICVGVWQNIDLATCKKGIENVKGMPGRMEKVIERPFTVIVDYAFTPNALEKVYRAIKENFNPKKLICVLGACGGGRDKWKRPVLGGLAAKYCQEIIVTNEDPYDEDPREIINQVASGTEGKGRKIIDRREAIRKSLKMAEAGDVVLITGKGCEMSICLAGGKRIPWDDRQVVREEIKTI